MSTKTSPHSGTTVSKVAQVTIYFWIMKILATTLGETTGDYIAMTLDLGYYVGLAITFCALAVILAVQITSRDYHPLVFWTAIIATTTTGTEISDFMDRSLGLGYFAGTAVLLFGLLASLAIWYYRNRSLRIYPITRKDTEIMFWMTVLFSNSLGTAFGDFLVDNLGLTFIQGAIVTAAVIALVGVVHYYRAVNDVALFWIAFIFTRPFGATFGDFLTKPISAGGLSIPREYASLITLGLLLSILYASSKLTRQNNARSA